jgi:hypothetical protein
MGRLAIRYWPDEVEMVEVSTPVAMFLATTEAFGTVAPVPSYTVPTMFPLVDCAKTETAQRPKSKRICHRRSVACRHADLTDLVELFIAPHLPE